MTENQKIDIYGLKIDVTDDDFNEKDVLSGMKWQRIKR